MSALPSSLSLLLILVGDVLVFLLIALSFRLLSPRKVSSLLWASPAVHLYTLFAVLLALYEEALAVQPMEALMGSVRAIVVAALVGSLLGRAIGHRIPVSLHPDGKWYYTGGRLLVALLVILLLPLAVDQATALFGWVAGVDLLRQTLLGLYPFNFLLVAVGSLFVLGTFLSITWRFEVWEKRKGDHRSSTPGPARVGKA